MHRICRERLSWVDGRDGVKLEMNGDQGKVWNKEQGQDLADVQKSNAGGKSTDIPDERGRQVRVRKAPGREMVLVPKLLKWLNI